MKKLTKRLVKILPVVLMVCFVVTSVFAANTNIEIPNEVTPGWASQPVREATGKIWATIVTIVQILAVAAVVFAGLRYMFASADQKADIKRSLGTLAIGAILVFCATTIIKFIVNSAEQVII